MSAAVQAKDRRQAGGCGTSARGVRGGKAWSRRVLSAARACSGIAIATPAKPQGARRAASILNVVREFYLGR